MAFIPTGITSIVNTVPSSVLVGASIMGTVPVTQTTSPWVVNFPSPSTISYQLAGSILAVSGSFSSPPQNSIIANQAAGSVLAVRTDNASVIAVLSNSSVATLQGTSPWVISNPSVTAYQGGAWSTSVTGGYVNVIGSVALGVGNTSVTQAGAWNVNVNSILGTYQEKNATVASVIGIPILWKNNFTTSTLSTISTNDPLPVQGSVMALQGTNPFIVQAVSSVLTIQTTSTNVSVLSVGAGVQITSVMNTIPSSMMVGASVFGTVPVTQTTSPWIINMPSPSIIATQIANSVMGVRTDNASVVAVLSNSSVAVLQGTNPWQINMPSPSVVAIQQAGSIMAVSGIAFTISSVTLLGGSILGTYADNSAWAEGNIGLYSLNVRNDTMSSISAADLRFTPNTVGPVGETIVANSPITKWVRGFGSVFNAGPSIQVIAPQGSSIFTYITGVQVTNVSANNVFVTFTGGLGGISSVLGYAPAPANGGAIIPLPNAWLTGANSGFSASVSGTASIFITAQGFISKT